MTIALSQIMIVLVKSSLNRTEFGGQGGTKGLSHSSFSPLISDLSIVERFFIMALLLCSLIATVNVPSPF